MMDKQAEELVLLVDRAEVPTWLAELNTVAGLRARAQENVVAHPDPNKKHPVYSLDYSTVAQIVIGGLGAVNGVFTLYNHISTISAKVKSRRAARTRPEPMIIMPGKSEPVTIKEAIEAADK